MNFYKTLFVTALLSYLGMGLATEVDIPSNLETGLADTVNTASTFAIIAKNITNFVNFRGSAPNTAIFCVAAPLVGALTILPEGGVPGFLGCVTANAITSWSLNKLHGNPYISPLWSYAIVPTIFGLLALKHGIIDVIRNNKTTQEDNKPFTQETFEEYLNQKIAVLCVQSAIAAPLLGLAALGISNVAQTCIEALKNENV